MQPAIHALLAGVGISFGLIVAIGAQNVFVLRQGIRREHVLAVVLVCALSDAVLMLAGVSGMAAVMHQLPWLDPVARWAGAVFLVAYGFLAARRAWHGGGALRVEPASAATPAPVQASAATALATRTKTATLWGVVLTTLALTWLNPHVYLDTLVLVGSIGGTYGADRWWFAAGAVAASATWFAGLGFGARFLGRWLRTPRAWRILDAMIAVVMLAIAVTLVAGA